jgi:hypothetical protein
MRLTAPSTKHHALHIAPPAWVAVLRKSGVRIDLEEADLTNQIEAYRLRQKFPGIAGVVYGGNLSEEETSWGLSHTIFEGAANLDESFGSQHLDFFVLLTSFPAKPEGSEESELTAVCSSMTVKLDMSANPGSFAVYGGSSYPTQEARA